MTPVSNYRMPVVRNQFFSSFEEGEPQPRLTSNSIVNVGQGPQHSLTAKTGVGFTGVRALRYSTNRFSRSVLFDVAISVTARTELSYVVLPVATAAHTYAGTYVAVDLEFEDGSTYSGLGGQDQHQVPLTALAQGSSKILHLDQWNYVRCDIGALANGRTIRAIVLTVDPPTELGATMGWLDDIRIGVTAPQPRDSVDYVRTTRGTHSSREFSRGNTFPATAVPHGFNLWTPVTNAGSLSWLYEYHRGNNAHNQPALEAFAVSHQPSPWIGDRHTFQLMPGIGALTRQRKHRALAFQHANETDRPYHYGIRFDNGISVDLAPTDHAAMFRFRFPTAPGWVLFDNVSHRSRVDVDMHTGTIHGYTSVASRSSSGTRRMFIYGVFDRPAVNAGMIRRLPWRKVSGYLVFDSAETTLRIGTSLISAAQAQRNVEQEIPSGTTFDDVRSQARSAWQQLLDRIDIEGATDDQRTTFYSSLYRMFLYPNSGHENTGTPHQPHYRHASVVKRHWRPSTPKRSGARIVDGKVFVNNGFWDTYRTIWPAYALFTPSRCAELIDGFTAHYREGGWIPRWSAPGYTNQMPGTNSDAAFSDAYLKGVTEVDVDALFNAAVRNATVKAPNNKVGRRGLSESIFLGYTPVHNPESVSWALENCLNDFALSQFSFQRYRDMDPGDPQHHEFLDYGRYFLHRSLLYVRHFDATVGFFRARKLGVRTNQPEWVRDRRHYDPTMWGGEYAETNGWNMAFSVPHDGYGLARLHGGSSALESTLDKFFSTPESADKPGSYGSVIHEMREAREVRLGQYGHSNQPSHHIPYMYLHAGAPSKTQAIVRDVLARCYVGSDIGQGYLGDEDNGEMSAWYVFSSLGFYPLTVGGGHYVIGSPLFTRATINLENGKQLVINAANNSPTSRYVRGVTLNGIPHTETFISHEQLVQGGVLDFDMADTPCSWGRDAIQPSVSTLGDSVEPLVDVAQHVTSDDGTDVAALIDDTSDTHVTFKSTTPTIDCLVPANVSDPVLLYTLTSAAREGDPRSWVLEGSHDGQQWTTLDRRERQKFAWRQQTRPFTVASPQPYRRYRLRITESHSRKLVLAQWELLAGDRRIFEKG